MNLQLSTFLHQNGITTLPDTKQWINRFEIESETSNRIYIIAQKADLSLWGCSCPGWKRFRRCKHLSAIKPLIDQLTQSSKILTLTNAAEQ